MVGMVPRLNEIMIRRIKTKGIAVFLTFSLMLLLAVALYSTSPSKSAFGATLTGSGGYPPTFLHKADTGQSRFDLVVDGEVTEIHSTSRTLREILQEIGFGEDAKFSLDLDEVIPADTTEIIGGTKKQIRIVSPAGNRTLLTYGRTWDEVLREIPEYTGTTYSLVKAMRFTPKDGDVVKFEETARHFQEVSLTVEPETQYQDDPELPMGEEVVLQEGVASESKLLFEVDIFNSSRVTRRLTSTEVIKAGQPEIISQGTKMIYDSQSNRGIGQRLAAEMGWTNKQWGCLERLWTRESNWNHLAKNSSSGAYGIPQSLPGTKMATVASDWRHNPVTQIKWGLGYIQGRYGTPCGAWGHSERVGWY